MQVISFLGLLYSRGIDGYFFFFEEILLI